MRLTLPRRWSSKRRSSRLVDPGAQSADAFRTLRLALELRQDSGSGNTIMFTAAEPGVGKSTVSANYALVSSLGQDRVLLVDGDLRNPSLHTTFEVDRTPGLVDALAEGAGSLESFVHPIPGLGHLDLLTTGRAVPRSSDLAASPRMAALLEEASSKYDLVVMDSPPLLAVADSEGLASHPSVEVALIVTKKTRRRDIRSAIRRLELIDARVAGVVVNREGSQPTYRY